jgi:hypothetical protein
MTRRRGPTRSARSYVLQFVLLAVLFVALYLFLIAGGPTVVGRIWAELIGAP